MDIKDIEVDFKVHDAYVAFSSEIVRIALLSPVVFAFFAAFAGEHPTAEAFAALIAPAHCCLTLGFSFMALAVFCGLIHRYFAVDFITTYIEIKRSTATGYGFRLKICTYAIIAAPVCLFGGAISLFIAVFQVLARS